jgi:UDP-N-acetylmuramate--alanine ligase
MIDLNNIKNIFFIGIGGIGMSALARYFNTRGVQITGYDRTETELTKQLIAEGMSIHYSDDINLIPSEIDLVIYTPAIPKDHKQLNYLLQNNFIVRKRSEILEILSANKFTIAVGGSHGKTTVSSMIAHILIQSGINCTAFLGGITTNYNSNFIDSKTMQKGKVVPLPFGEGQGGANSLWRGVGGEAGEIFVIEADEFDRSFLRLKPDIAVITAVDTDHLDIYGTKENIEDAFLQFAQKVKPGGKVVANENVSIIPKIQTETIIYGCNNANVFVKNLRYENGEMTFDFQIINPKSEIRNLKLPMSGSHNAENALAAATVATLLNIPPDKIKTAIATFNGIKRRFEFIIKRNDLVFIDDYAHHPEEIKRFLQSVKELYADKKVTVIFQPHLFSRTRDLQHEFAEALSIADKAIVLDIYPARELPMPGVTSALIFDKITTTNKVMLNKNELLGYLEAHDKPEVICTVGAGDIDKLVEPIKQLYSK